MLGEVIRNGMIDIIERGGGFFQGDTEKVL